jgi:hypothetical protein
MTSFIESRVIEEVTRPDELAIGELETSSYYSWRTVEAAGITFPDSYRHQRAMVGASHPAFYYVRISKGFQYFTHGGKYSLRANDADRVILAYVSARQER